MIRHSRRVDGDSRGSQWSSETEEEESVAREDGLFVLPEPERSSCAYHETEDWCEYEGRPHANVAGATHAPMGPAHRARLLSRQAVRDESTLDRATTRWLRESGYGPDGEPL